MTSEERRAVRRKRRQEKRARAKAERTRTCTLANVASMDSLVSASRRAAHGVMWKHSVQRYMAYYLLNAARTRDDLLAGRDVRRGFTRFDVVERGKVRHISAPRISERVAQKSLTRNVLTPALVPTATYSNAANIEGRGTDYSIRLMKRHLAANWRKRGREGYILLMDDAGYFDSLLHSCAKRLVGNAVPDAGAAALAGLFVDAHGERGLGLGSEPDQVLAVCYQNGIDHYIAEMLGVEKAELNDLLSTSDVVSMHAPANEDCRNIINAQNLPLIRDGAVFINTARGLEVDETALIEELKKGRFFACLDVTSPEPPAMDNPLRTLPNVILTPHMAGGHAMQNRSLMGRNAIKEVYNYLTKGLIAYEVRGEMLSHMA